MQEGTYIGVGKVKTDQEYNDIALDDPHLLEIAEDIRIEQLTQPIVVNSDFEIVDGRYRLKAVKEILRQGKIKYTIKNVTGDHRFNPS